jgi:hypothetical protein
MQRLFEASLTDAARRTVTIFPHAGVGCLTARTSLRSS